MSVDRLKLENPNRIERPSSDLREFAIETFPLELAFSQIELAITHENGAEIHPKITQHLEQNVNTGKFVETHFRPKDGKGKPPTHIQVSLSNGYLTNFKNSLLTTLIKQGYKVIGADLAVTTFHSRDDGGSGTMGGDHMSTGAVMSRWSICIQFGNGTPEQKQQLRAWFESLKEKQAKK